MAVQDNNKISPSFSNGRIRLVFLIFTESNMNGIVSPFFHDDTRDCTTEKKKLARSSQPGTVVFKHNWLDYHYLFSL